MVKTPFCKAHCGGWTRGTTCSGTLAKRCCSIWTHSVHQSFNAAAVVILVAHSSSDLKLSAIYFKRPQYQTSFPSYAFWMLQLARKDHNENGTRLRGKNLWLLSAIWMSLIRSRAIPRWEKSHRGRITSYQGELCTTIWMAPIVVPALVACRLEIHLITILTKALKENQNTGLMTWGIVGERAFQQLR